MFTLIPCFFFNDPATTEIYPLSLHHALPIWTLRRRVSTRRGASPSWARITSSRRSTRCSSSGGSRRSTPSTPTSSQRGRSEEHTSELQSRQYIVCRLLVEKKKKN